MAEYVLALDQGTTSSRAILFDRDGSSVQMANREFTQLYPRPGWVEHDPMEVWSTQLATAHEAIARAGTSARDIVAIGITNQRETTVLWDTRLRAGPWQMPSCGSAGGLPDAAID